jgi:hypothetical protein
VHVANGEWGGCGAVAHVTEAGEAKIPRDGRYGKGT